MCTIHADLDVVLLRLTRKQMSTLIRKIVLADLVEGGLVHSMCVVASRRFSATCIFTAVFAVASGPHCFFFDYVYVHAIDGSGLLGACPMF